jgi:hypothetical protein
MFAEYWLAILMTCLGGATAVVKIDRTITADAHGTLGQPPPPGARVLFDGRDLSAWIRRRDGKPAAWIVNDGYMEVVPGEGFLMTKEKFRDFQLHLEFWIPLMADKHGQDRGNSGVYLQGRYEVQILDSFNEPTDPDRACGALYTILAPLTNACLQPEEWQTYDITFRAPRTDGQGRVMEKGEITVIQNGIPIIQHGRFDRITDIKHDTALDSRLGDPGPIMLQDHGARVRFRNIWIKPLN